MNLSDHIKLLSPVKWDDYELIDSGDFQKLERFGRYILSRPEPQAVWAKDLSDREWEKSAHATYTRKKGFSDGLADEEKGEWKVKPGMPDQWIIEYPFIKPGLIFRLGLTSFKHIGIFPEQAANWEYISKSVLEIHPPHTPPHTPPHFHPHTPPHTHPPTPPPTQVLNLFAYTGGASLAASAAGAKVTHLDSVKQVINWANENAKLSDLGNIRWIIDDALKFVQREVRRGSVYQGIILDPPAYGRGPKGEKWVLSESIREMVKSCLEILDKKNGFLLLNLYSVGFSAIIAESLVNSIFKDVENAETGELFLNDHNNKRLPLGVFYRFKISRKPN